MSKRSDPYRVSLGRVVLKESLREVAVGLGVIISIFILGVLFAVAFVGWDQILASAPS